jgi:hypothetical protein
MKIMKIAALLALSLLISSCVKPAKTIDLSAKYSGDKGPKLNINDYLNGNLDGWGYFEDNKGIITRRFTVKIAGEWDGKRGTIKRRFMFGDGKKDSRTWLITLDKNDFSAVGHGVVGTANGQQYKGLAQISYRVKMPIDGEQQEVDVIETTYSINNNSSISIFELGTKAAKKGKITMSLHKVSKNTVKSSKALNKKIVTPAASSDIIVK